MYKLVILDIDGTLITHKRKVTKRTKEVIKQVLDKGVKIAISTGRNHRMAMRVLKNFPNKFIYSCVGGAEIYDEKGDFLHNGNLSMEEVRVVLERIKNRECLYQVSFSNRYYKYLHSGKAKKYEIFGNNSIKHHLINRYIGISRVNSLEEIFSTEHTHANEIAIGGDRHIIDEIKEIIENEFEDLQARDDMWENYLFIGRKHNSKSYAMKKISEYFGVDISEVIAIGDDCNDLDMIRDAGLGIAMGNAVDAVKAVAKDITYTNKEEGVAKALEHYILNENKGKINA